MQTNRLETRRNRERGASAVEFAIIAPLLVLLLTSIVELGVLFWANLTMQYAVREGARYAVTGRSDLDPNQSDQQRHLAVIEAIRSHSMGLFDRVQPRINSIRHDAPNEYSAGMFGRAGHTFVLRLDCSWPIMMPILRPFFTDGVYRFSVAATMRNEAF